MRPSVPSGLSGWFASTRSCSELYGTVPYSDEVAGHTVSGSSYRVVKRGERDGTGLDPAVPVRVNAAVATEAPSTSTVTDHVPGMEAGGSPLTVMVNHSDHGAWLVAYPSRPKR